MLLKSPEAIEDIENIWFNIALDKPKAAHDFAFKLEEKFALLEYAPLIGRIFNAESKNYSKIRVFPLGKYLIFYLPIDGGIKIYRVLHG